VQKGGDFVIERNRQTRPAMTLAETNKNAVAAKSKQKARCRNIIHRRATRIVLFGHQLSSCPAGLKYVQKGLSGQRERDQNCLDLIVRNDPKPNINQPTMPAVIAPASVASI
jgi:hypothetical protein